MYGLKTLVAGFAVFASTAVAQDALEVPAELTSFEPRTGTRSLWIPFQTISGLEASIAAANTALNETVYVVACPTASPSCAIAPNVTLTEGPTMAEYAVTNTAGVATVNCNFNGTEVTSIECNQIQRDHENNISKQSTMLKPSQVVFQDIAVTATMTNSTTIEKAAKTSAEPTSTSTLIMSTSNSGAMPTEAPWSVGGAVAGGLVALAAL